MFRNRTRYDAQLFVGVLIFAVGSTQQSLSARVYLQETKSTSPTPIIDASDDPLGDSRQKVMRYYRALRSRPGPGTLFDRFYDAWLESASLVELESFLQKNVAESRAWEDQAILASLYSKKRDHVPALQLFELALQQAPNQSHLWCEKARLSAETLNHEQALLDLRRASESNEAFHRDRELQLKIVRQQTAILLSRGNTSEAVAAWSHMLDLHPDDELLFEDVIDQQVSLGAWDQALATSNRLLRLTTDPYQVVTRRMRHGMILRQSGKAPDAIELYAQTLNMVGRNAWQERELLSRIREQYQQTDDVVGLRDCLQSLLAVEPDRLALQMELAHTYELLGQADHAVTIWTQIVNVTPGERSYRESLIAALVASGDLNAAITQLKSLIEYFPDDANLLIQLANYQQQRGDTDEVRSVLANFLVKSGHSENAYLKVARHFEKHGPNEHVSQTFDDGITRNSHSITLRDRLAHWLYQNNDKPTAIQQWRDMAASGDETERMRIARILIGLREHEAAEDILLNFGDPQLFSSHYLGLLIDTSIERQEFERTIPWLRKNAEQSRSWNELEPTIKQALVVFRNLVTPSKMLEAFGVSALETDGHEIAELDLGVACVLTRLLMQERKFNEAERLLVALDVHWSERSTDNPRPLEMLLIQRLELCRQGDDWAATTEILQRLIKMPSSRRTEYFAKLVDLAIRGERLDEALQTVQQWKQPQNSDSVPWIMESQLLTRLQRGAESVEVLRTAVSRFPHDLELVRLLAEQCVARGHNTEAEHLYWRLFNRSSDSKERLQWIRPLTMLDGREGSNNSVENILQGRLATNPESLDLQLALAEFYRMIGQVEKQQAVLLAATRKNPNHLVVLNQTIAFAIAQGKWDVAIEVLTRVHEIDPFGPATWRLIELYLNTDQLSPAVDLIHEFMISQKASPRDVEAVVLGLLDREQLEMAHRLTATVVADCEHDWRLRYLLGCVRVELGEFESAKQDFLTLLQTEKNPLQVVPRHNTWLPAPKHLTHPNWTPTLQWLLMLEELQPYLSRDRRWGSVFSRMPLPTDPDECDRFAILQLLSLISNQFIDDQNLLDKIHLDGSPNLGVVSAILLRNNQTPNQLEALNQKYAEVDDYWLGHLYLGQSVLDALQLLRVADRFQTTRPTASFLAWDAVRQAESSDDVDWERGCQVLQGLESVSTPDEILVERMIRVLLICDSTLFDLSSEDDVPDLQHIQSFQTTAEALLSRWKPAKAAMVDEIVQRRLVKIELKQLVSGPDLGPLIQRMEHEMAGSAIWSDRYFLNSKSVSAVDLPIRLALDWSESRHLDALPSAFMTYWYGLMELEDEARRIAGEESGSDDGPVAWVLQLREHRHLIENPFLEFSLWIEGDISEMEGRRKRTLGEVEQDLDDAEAMLSEWQEREPGSFDAHVLGASLAIHRRQWRNAADIIATFLQQPLTGEQRHLANAFLLDIGCQSATDETIPSFDKNYVINMARESARQFKAYPLDIDQQSELLDALHALGLNQEAADYKLANSAVITPMSSLERLDQSTRSTPLPHDVMQATLRRKAEQAKKLWLSRFRASVQHQLHLPLNQHYFEWVEALRSEYSRLDYVAGELPQLIAAMGATPSTGAMVAVAYDVEGSHQQALEAYRVVLKELPTMDSIRLRIVALELTLGGSDLKRIWQNLSDRDRLKFAEAQLKWAVDSRLAPEIVFSSMEAAIEELESNPLTSTNGSACLDLCLGVCSRQLSLNSVASSMLPPQAGNSTAGWTIDQSQKRLPGVRDERVRLRLLGATKVHSFNERQRDLIDKRWTLFQRLNQLAIRPVTTSADRFGEYLHACCLHGQKPAGWLFDVAVAFQSVRSAPRFIQRGTSGAFFVQPSWPQSGTDAERYQDMLQGLGNQWTTIKNTAALYLAYQLVERHPENRAEIDRILAEWSNKFGVWPVP